MTRTRIPAGLLAAALIAGGCASNHTYTSGEHARLDRPREVDRALEEISAERLRADVDELCAFGTRHTLSETDSDTRGIGAARRWVLAQFTQAIRSNPRAKAYLAQHRQEADGRRIMRDVDIVNVICEIPGTMQGARERYYYVLGHLDSRVTDPNNAESDAPGANDDASGVAVMLELARVLAGEPIDATVVLVATSGEEQGLYGARLHEESVYKSGRDIRAVLNNDTVGDPYGPFSPDSPRGEWSRGYVRVFAEGVPPEGDAEAIALMSKLGAENDSAPRTLARYMTGVAAVHRLDVQPYVIYRNDRFLRGGDHTPFVRRGLRAVRLTVPFEDYARQHEDVRKEGAKQFGDLPQYVDEYYLAGVARLNAATLLHLTRAPSAPADARIITAGLTNDTTLRWTASPEPDVAGYEIVWRETTSFDWQFGLDAGATTEITVDLSKDNWLFGVRAYDSEGYRSPVAFPIAATE